MTQEQINASTSDRLRREGVAFSRADLATFAADARREALGKAFYTIQPAPAGPPPPPEARSIPPPEPKKDK